MRIWSGVHLRKHGKAETPEHVHPCIQVFCITRGVLNLVTGSGSYLVFPGFLVLIPARLRHQAITLGEVDGWSTYLPDGLRVTGQAVVLRASGLLSAILSRIAELGHLSRSKSDSCLKFLLEQELQRARPFDPGVPFPVSRQLRRVADRIFENEALLGLDECARLAAMSPRNFTRRFKQETGLTFARWRRRVLNEVALKLLLSQKSVAEVAEQTGFQTVSAFIASFRAQFGASPLKVRDSTQKLVPPNQSTRRSR